MFKLDNFGVILFVSFSYKKLLQCSFYENWKNRCKNRFFRKKFKTVCVLQRRACTQIQNFKRNYLENYNDSEHVVKTKNAPFFMIFPNISFFHMVVNYWTGPLRNKNSIIHAIMHLLTENWTSRKSRISGKSRISRKLRR